VQQARTTHPACFFAETRDDIGLKRFPISYRRSRVAPRIRVRLPHHQERNAAMGRLCTALFAALLGSFRGTLRDTATGRCDCRPAPFAAPDEDLIVHMDVGNFA
jgi:hypothetical protein